MGIYALEKEKTKNIKIIEKSNLKNALLYKKKIEGKAHEKK